VSKAKRRRQRPGYQSSIGQPSGSTPKPTSAGGTPSTPAAFGAPGAAASSDPTVILGATAGAGPTDTGTGTSAASVATGKPATGAASTARPGGGAGASRATGTSTRPAGTRAGRRERQRTAYQPSFLERHRTPLILIAAVVGVAVLSVFVFLSASQPAYACSTVWTPEPTASPTAGATPNLGYAQPDMGHQHVAVGTKVTYTYCAPASGNHYNVAGVSGPIPARVYGPNDNVVPMGWIHNLEHGGLVILYQGSSAGATPEGQAAFKAFYDAFPPVASCYPVIARFDQMSSPFQAIVWGRVLPLQTFDQAQIHAFWQQWGGRTNLEPLCPTPNSSANPNATEPPNESASPADTSAPTDTPAPTENPTAAPSAS
jgi:hypothetical protein